MNNIIYLYIPIIIYEYQTNTFNTYNALLLCKNVNIYRAPIE